MGGKRSFNEHDSSTANEGKSNELQHDTDSTDLKSFNEWRIPQVKDGQVFFIPEFICQDLANSWFDDLNDLETWYHPVLKLYGKEVMQSRSIAAYTIDPKLKIKYSGHVVNLHTDYPSTLLGMQKKVEDFLGVKFNHIMLNRYLSGEEYIGRHRDTKENNIIASLSLGAERTFIMTPNKALPGVTKYSWKLTNGSLLVMGDGVQENWKHEIPKETSVKDARISITFRQIKESKPSNKRLKVSR